MAVDAASAASTALPEVILVSGNGSNSLSYTLGPLQTLQIEAISVNADATAAAGGTITAEYLDQSGVIVAESSSAAQLQAGTTAEVTFAPYLPDSSVVGVIAGESTLQTGLVQTTLPPAATVTIVATDTAVILTGARIWAVSDSGSVFDVLTTLLPVYLTPTSGEVIRPDPIDGRAD
jgi:hypothetical protein